MPILDSGAEIQVSLGNTCSTSICKNVDLFFPKRTKIAFVLFTDVACPHCLSTESALAKYPKHVVNSLSISTIVLS